MSTGAWPIADRLRGLIACGVLTMAWAAGAPAQEDSLSTPRFPLVPLQDAWTMLPRINPPLPEWALALVESLPKTTGSMLELDYLHRVQNPLGPVWAGKIRWVVADALKSEYGRRYAAADLRRAGLGDTELEALAAGGPAGSAEAMVLGLVRRLTLEAYAVSDDEFAQLQTVWNVEQIVAVVHTVAFANFENRIFLGLGLEVGPAGPVPATAYDFDRAARPQLLAPTRPSWEEARGKLPATAAPPAVNWSVQSLEEIEAAVAGQRERQPRIPLPPPERLEKLPPQVREESQKIVWSNLSLGYQPRLTSAWFECMGTFQSEAKFDRVFSNSYFWVITRANNCFY